MTQTNHYHEQGQSGSRPGNPYAHRFLVRRPSGAIPVLPNHFNFKKLFKKVTAISTGGLSEIASNKKVQAIAKKAVTAPISIAKQVVQNKGLQNIGRTVASGGLSLAQQQVKGKSLAQMVKKPLQVFDPIAAARTMAPQNVVRSIKQLSPIPMKPFSR